MYNSSMEHYYGKMVRRLFVAGAIIMAVTLPFFSDKIYEPLFLSILVIIAISIVAGFNSPRFYWSVLLDVLISLFASAAFEYYAVNAYKTFGPIDFFWTNQLLTIIFLVTLYFSIKTLREMN